MPGSPESLGVYYRGMILFAATVFILAGVVFGMAGVAPFAGPLIAVGTILAVGYANRRIHHKRTR